MHKRSDCILLRRDTRQSLLFTVEWRRQQGRRVHLLHKSSLVTGPGRQTEAGPTPPAAAAPPPPLTSWLVLQLSLSITLHSIIPSLFSVNCDYFYVCYDTDISWRGEHNSRCAQWRVKNKQPVLHFGGIWQPRCSNDGPKTCCSCCRRTSIFDSS